MLLGEFDQGECLWLQSKSERAVLECLRLRSRECGGFAELADLGESGKCGTAHFVPGGERGAMVLVDDSDAGGWRAAHTLEVQRDSFRRT